MHTKTLNISYLDKLLRSPLLRSDFSLVRLILEITTFLLFSRSTPKSPKIPQNSQTLKFLKAQILLIFWNLAYLDDLPVLYSEC